MNKAQHHILHAFMVLAMLLLVPYLSMAGTWTYDSSSNRITHSDAVWVLNVSRNNTALTIIGVQTEPSSASSLPLDDPINGGYQITAIGNDAFYECSSLSALIIPDQYHPIA